MTPRDAISHYLSHKKEWYRCDDYIDGEINFQVWRIKQHSMHHISMIHIYLLEEEIRITIGSESEILIVHYADPNLFRYLDNLKTPQYRLIESLKAADDGWISTKFINQFQLMQYPVYLTAYEPHVALDRRYEGGGVELIEYTSPRLRKYMRWKM